MTANRSYDTGGTDSPTQQWMRQRVRVNTHPEWGVGRVLRWFPAGGGLPARLRILCENLRAPRIVSTTDVEIVDSPQRS